MFIEYNYKIYPKPKNIQKRLKCLIRALDRVTDKMMDIPSKDWQLFEFHALRARRIRNQIDHSSENRMNLCNFVNKKKVKKLW